MAKDKKSEVIIIWNFPAIPVRSGLAPSKIVLLLKCRSHRDNQKLFTVVVAAIEVDGASDFVVDSSAINTDVVPICTCYGYCRGVDVVKSALFMRLMLLLLKFFSSCNMCCNCCCTCYNDC